MLAIDNQQVEHAVHVGNHHPLPRAPRVFGAISGLMPFFVKRPRSKKPPSSRLSGRIARNPASLGTLPWREADQFIVSCDVGKLAV